MEKPRDAPRIHEHGPILQLAENLWRVEGALPGMSLRRAMTIARRTDGRLVIHSAVLMQEPAMHELERLGEPAFLVVPSRYHRLDAPAYKERYPGVRVLAPRGARKGVEKRVPVEGTYEDYPPDDAVRLEPLRGVGDAEGVMVVRSSEGVTLVLNDIVFNMDRKPDFFGYVMTTMMGSAPGPRISRLAKLTLVEDRAVLKDDLLRLAETPGLVRVIPAHEKVTAGAEAADTLRKATGYL
jgi:hypothetical protein